MTFEAVNQEVAIVIADKTSLNILSANERFSELTGYKWEEMSSGFSFAELLHPSDDVSQTLALSYKKMFENGGASSLFQLIYKKDHTPVLTTVKINSQDAEEGTVIVEIYENKIEAPVPHGPLVVPPINETTTFTYDRATDTLVMTEFFGDLPPKENVMKNYLSDNIGAQYIYPEDWSIHNRLLHACLTKETDQTVDIRYMAISNAVISVHRINMKSKLNEAGEIIGTYGSSMRIDDPSEESMLKVNIREMRKLITTDPLTGLYNMSTFVTFAAQVLEARDADAHYAIVFTDIRDFSYVNNNYGMETGDDLIRQLANFLRSRGATPGTMWARVHADQFITFIREDRREDIVESVQRMNLRFNAILNQRFPITTLKLSSGIFFFEDAEIDATEEYVKKAIGYADLARRDLRRNPDKTEVRIFDETLANARDYSQKISGLLKPAMKQNRIVPFLQPQISLSTGEAVSCEALVRWREEDGSWRFPIDFIGVLEETGGILDLDMHMFEESLKILRRWIDDGKRPVPISVNFSSGDFLTNGFANRLVALTEKYNIPKDLIAIEVTETVFIEGREDFANQVNTVLDYGFPVHIDDFGMGASSVALLMETRSSAIKIDKYFLDHYADSDDKRLYVERVCKLLEATQRLLIAEGIETKDQAEFIESCGVDVVQGWLFDKALPVTEFEDKYIKAVE